MKITEPNWKDYLEEAVMEGLELHYHRQNRDYTLYYTGKFMNDNGVFEVRQVMSGNVKQFTSFKDAYDWLWYGIK